MQIISDKYAHPDFFECDFSQVLEHRFLIHNTGGMNSLLTLSLESYPSSTEDGGHDDADEDHGGAEDVEDGVHGEGEVDPGLCHQDPEFAPSVDLLQLEGFFRRHPRLQV